MVCSTARICMACTGQSQRNRCEAGTAPHIHHREDEAFYVIEGDYEFLSGGEIVRVGADSLLYLPKGTLHGHKNIGEGWVRCWLPRRLGACTSASAWR